MSETTFTPVTNTCPKCSKPCKSKFQCKECHLAMIAEREGECKDCHKSFPAKREDGTFRQRCRECQTKFNENMHKCSTCEKSFFANPKEGVVYENCFDCHKSKNFKKCDNESCTNQTRVSLPFCQDCYKVERSKPRVLTKAEEKNCEGCDAKTYKKFCSDCSTRYRELKDLEFTYMVSTCQFPGCRVREKGSMKFCEEHRKF